MLLQYLIELDGKVELYARDGRFLGLLSSDIHDRNSILNPKTYGNIANINSIYYEHGIYGGEYGRYSPYNRYCLYPPSLVFQQQYLGIVTKNTSISNYEVTIVDPDLLLAIYRSLSERDRLFNNWQEAISRN